jgi:hypothetical protein
MQPIDSHSHDPLPLSPAPSANETLLRHPLLPFVVLALLGFLGVWGVIQAKDANRRLALESHHYRETFRPSEAPAAFSAQGFEPDEGGTALTPVGEPLMPSAAEQELSRTLAELKSKLARIERLAQRVGQLEAYKALENKHQALKKSVADRSVPWKESERVDLDRQARTLNAEVTKLSDRLEEVAAISL